MRKQIISDAAAYVRASIINVDPGHDWWHVQRVWYYAKYIGQQEGADLLVVELAALLHDIADDKFHKGDKNQTLNRTSSWLHAHGLSPDATDEVISIVNSMGFKAQYDSQLSLNCSVVLDADRLDALGAIGVARAFSFGGFSSLTLHDPGIPPKLDMSRKDYRNHKGTVVNHFYEKLFLLEEMMLTETGCRLASDRASFLRQFLAMFLDEWTECFEMNG